MNELKPTDIVIGKTYRNRGRLIVVEGFGSKDGKPVVDGRTANEHGPYDGWAYVNELEEV